MRIDGYEFKRDFARKSYSAGRGEGHEKGREEGRAAGQAEALLRVLVARGLEVSESQRSQLLSCTDQQTLAGWLDRAPHVEQVEELFSEG